MLTSYSLNTAGIPSLCLDLLQHVPLGLKFCQLFGNACKKGGDLNGVSHWIVYIIHGNYTGADPGETLWGPPLFSLPYIAIGHLYM